MASHNPQEHLFDKHIQSVKELIEKFVTSVVYGGDYITAETEIINYLTDMYSESFLGEVDYILDVLGYNVTPQNLIEVRNKVDTTAFVRSNRHRLKDIFRDHRKSIQKLVEDNRDTMSKGDILNTYWSNIDRLAISEVQMGIEKASVQSSKLFEDVTGVKLLKTWNSIGDDKTCPICRAMDGLTIPVTESFQAVAPSASISEELSYTGGDIVYAHPRCRCWVTYSEA